MLGEGWPWAVAFAWLVVFECWALATNHRTLSERARSIGRRRPWVPWVVVAVVVVLVGHFWMGWLW